MASNNSGETYKDMVESTLNDRELEEYLVRVLINKGCDSSYAKKIVKEYLDS